jgi:hypothetical protein
MAPLRRGLSHLISPRKTSRLTASRANHRVAGIEAGKLEVRPGVANLMKILSRIAPEFTLKQMAKMIPSFSLRS